MTMTHIQLSPTSFLFSRGEKQKVIILERLSVFTKIKKLMTKDPESKGQESEINKVSEIA